MAVRLSLVVLLFVVMGCSSSRMYIDPALGSRAEPMPVERAKFMVKRWVRFGPFRAEVLSGIPWEWSGSVLGREFHVAYRTHRVLVSDGGQKIQASCRTRRAAIEHRIFSIDPSLGRMPLVECAVRPEAGGDPWVMSVWSAPRTLPNRYEGTLVRPDGEEAIYFQSEHRIEGKESIHPDPFGYTIMRSDAAVAAVETDIGKTVWIDPSLPQEERLRTAAVAAALLLFDPSREEGEELTLR